MPQPEQEQPAEDRRALAIALVGFVYKQQPWMEQAECSGLEPDLADKVFFGAALDDRPWDDYCNRCPVRRACHAYGVETDSTGVWGGEYMLGRGGEYNLKRKLKAKARSTGGRMLLLEAGVCRHGHVINGPEDVLVEHRPGRNPNHRCRKCEEAYRKARDTKQIMLEEFVEKCVREGRRIPSSRQIAEELGVKLAWSKLRAAKEYLVANKGYAPEDVGMREYTPRVNRVREDAKVYLRGLPQYGAGIPWEQKERASGIHHQTLRAAYNELKAEDKRG